MEIWIARHCFVWVTKQLYELYVNSLRPRQMDAISPTTFSNAFSWMKMFEFRLKFHGSLFTRVQLTIFQHWFKYRLGTVQATSHYLNQWWLVYRRLYASLGLNELTMSLIYISRVILSCPLHVQELWWVWRSRMVTNLPRLLYHWHLHVFYPRRDRRNYGHSK